MRTNWRTLGNAAMGLLLATAMTGTAYAQPTTPPDASQINFGDDTSEWANDGECDDPRFEGTGSATELVDADLMKDATDCRTAFEAGTVTLKADADAGGSAADVPIASAANAINWGDDSSEWANDGECDDPRFEGEGSASELVDADLMKDATDCRTAYEAGTITLVNQTAAAAGTPTSIDDIDFGDDTSEWANDGECDDPRFTGTGSANTLLDTDLMKDATDCRAAYEAGTVTLASDGGSDAAPTVDSIDFGDDSSRWANNGECDDPRFTGTGSASKLVPEDRMADATDCRAAFEAGTVTFVGGDDIDYGNDTSDWANDGECDDPRFTGTGVASSPLNSDIKRDATDCQAAVEAGTATYTGEIDAAAFDYGSDFSQWANDGECDDPRFEGPGTNKKLLPDDEMGDATDCKALVESGDVSIIAVYQPDYAAGAPYDTSDIDFGDNSSSYANDQECDDPRFVGPGMAYAPIDENRMADADDCSAAYADGTIVLRAGEV